MSVAWYDLRLYFYKTKIIYDRLNCAKLDFTCSKSISFSCFERLDSHTGAERYPAVGSSGEYWSIGVGLNQRFAGMNDLIGLEG